MSRANRGKHYVRGHYSHADGKRDLMDQLQEMMSQSDGAERDAYRRAMDELDRV